MDAEAIATLISDWRETAKAYRVKGLDQGGVAYANCADMLETIYAARGGGEAVAFDAHDKSIIADIEAMARSNENGWWSKALAAAALRLIYRSGAPPAPAIPDGDTATACRWPNRPFEFRDEPGEHDPCYVIMPDGCMLTLNHHAENGVDQARAQFIVKACNAAFLSAAPSPEVPR